MRAAESTVHTLERFMLFAPRARKKPEKGKVTLENGTREALQPPSQVAEAFLENPCFVVR